MAMVSSHQSSGQCSAVACSSRLQEVASVGIAALVERLVDILFEQVDLPVAQQERVCQDDRLSSVTSLLIYIYIYIYI